MPTDTTAQILGIYSRRIHGGKFIIVNKYLQKELTQLCLFHKQMEEKISTNNGSIQQIDEIPQKLKELFKTAWEMLDDRGPSIDQAQNHPQI